MPVNGFRVSTKFFVGDKAILKLPKFTKDAEDKTIYPQEILKAFISHFNAKYKERVAFADSFVSDGEEHSHMFIDVYIPGDMSKEAFEKDLAEFKSKQEGIESIKVVDLAKSAKLAYPEKLSLKGEDLEIAKQLFEKEMGFEYDPENEDDQEDILRIFNEHQKDLRSWRLAEVRVDMPVGKFAPGVEALNIDLLTMYDSKMKKDAGLKPYMIQYSENSEPEYIGFFESEDDALSAVDPEYETEMTTIFELDKDMYKEMIEFGEFDKEEAEELDKYFEIDTRDKRPHYLSELKEGQSATLARRVPYDYYENLSDYFSEEEIKKIGFEKNSFGMGFIPAGSKITLVKEHGEGGGWPTLEVNGVEFDFAGSMDKVEIKDVFIKDEGEPEDEDLLKLCHLLGEAHDKIMEAQDLAKDLIEAGKLDELIEYELDDLEANASEFEFMGDDKPVRDLLLKYGVDYVEEDEDW